MGVNSKRGVQSKRRCESHESCVCIVGFPACGCQKKSVYPNMSVYLPECLRSIHTRMFSFHLYSNVDIILFIPECLHLVYTLICLYTHPNICFPWIPEHLHSMYTRMSAFHVYPNVCILCIPECLHSMYTQNNVDSSFGSRVEKKGHWQRLLDVCNFPVTGLSWWRSC